MADPFDTDPDELLESEDATSEYEKGNFDIEPEIPTAPSPDIPSPEDNYGDVDGNLRNSFWLLVLVFNVSLFAVSIGVMLVGFGTHPRLGLQVFAVGVVFGLYGWYRYRKTKERIEDGEFDVGEKDGIDETDGETQ